MSYVFNKSLVRSSIFQFEPNIHISFDLWYSQKPVLIRAMILVSKSLYPLVIFILYSISLIPMNVIYFSLVLDTNVCFGFSLITRFFSLITNQLFCCTLFNILSLFDLCFSKSIATEALFAITMAITVFFHSEICFIFYSFLFCFTLFFIWTLKI
jgi:hypothetical protein